MKNYQLNNFIDVNDFVHKEIFNKKKYHWDVISEISKYLNSTSLGNIETVIPEGACLINPELISIGKGTIIESGAYIKGPCVIGENCQIRNGAYLRENVVIGNNCIVGHCVEIKSSVILNNTNISHFVYVGDSVIGNNVNLGAGVKCANVRLDKKEVLVSNKENDILVTIKKLGVLIGDNVQIGCNCVTSPATIIGKNSICFPGINIWGYIKNSSLVKNDNKIVVESLN